MDNKFDELTKAMAKSLTRREAFKRFGAALAGAMVAWLSGGRVQARSAKNGFCVVLPNPGTPDLYFTGACLDPATCHTAVSSDCPSGQKATGSLRSMCGHPVSKGCSF